MNNIKKQLLLLLCAIFFSFAGAYAKTYIVAVGLNNYDPSGNCTSLPCSVGDAQAISSFFHNHHNSEVFMLKDNNATRDHILRVLRAQFAKAGDNDQIIFAYSGHGFDGGISCYDSDGQGNTRLILCSEIQDILRASKARRKVMFINSCHSGSFSKKYRDDPRIRRFNPNNSDIMLYMSSRANENSWEAYEMTNSFFFDRLLEALKGAADVNGDKKVTARELFNYVNEKVIADTEGMQHPQMYGKFPDDMVVITVD